jgi:hypothetical protein
MALVSYPHRLRDRAEAPGRQAFHLYQVLADELIIH